ncbi:hypothetical protein [Aureimonas leprariae]|uniref:hypothetical protein n=1 Tax=Plantimonas leprariae TaxID=2615207 RepID=UPI001386D3FB|nr:hypothetical protein [Aureimonas leprariae]
MRRRAVRPAGRSFHGITRQVRSETGVLIVLIDIQLTSSGGRGETPVFRHDLKRS